jgi:hypothetical protein
MSSIFGIGTALTPVGGQQSDSASEIAQRKRQSSAAASSQRFSTTDETGDQTAPKTSLLQKTRDAAGAAISQLMRRATDRGELPTEAKIEIPPHLERRRAWREAFGLNTWHTQQIAQTEETPISDEVRAEAIQAYRSGGRRGRLDLDLAQQVTMTV